MKHSTLRGVLVASITIFAANLNAQESGLTPEHGSITLQPGTASPVELPVQAGGLLNAAEQSALRSAGCRGRFAPAPDVSISVPPGLEGSELQLALLNIGDASLVVRSPAGSWHCTGSLQSTTAIAITAPAAGTYEVWVANHQRGYADGRLTVRVATGQAIDSLLELAAAREAAEAQGGSVGATACVQECRALQTVCEDALLDLEVACAIRRRSGRARIAGSTIRAVTSVAQSTDQAISAGADLAGNATEVRAERLDCSADTAEQQAQCSIVYAECLQTCF